jgi:hypothetical protein
MKRVVQLFVIPFIGITLLAGSADAQRSGSMQATARVLDTREPVAGLHSAHTVASRLARRGESRGTVETSLTRVSVELAAPTQADRPRIASVTINYLRN